MVSDDRSDFTNRERFSAAGRLRAAPLL